MLQIIKKALLSAVSVLLSVSAGCSSSVGIAYVDNVSLAAADIYDPTDENYHDLSAEGALRVSDLIDSDEDFIFFSL